MDIKHIIAIARAYFHGIVITLGHISWLDYSPSIPDMASFLIFILMGN